MSIRVYHSPCGGVGKTSIAIASAIKSAKAGKNVLLMDLSTFGAISFHLRDSSLKSGLNRVSALFYDSEEEIDEEELKEQLTRVGIKRFKEIKNLSTLYAASPVKMDKLDYGHVKKLVTALSALEFDEIIVDTSSDLHIRNIALFESCDELYTIATPDLQCAWQLNALNELMTDLFIDMTKVKGIMNKYKSYSSFNIKESEGYLGYPFVTVIPYKGNKWIEVANHILKKEQVAKAKHYREIQRWLSDRL